jgi:hypothetical protein
MNLAQIQNNLLLLIKKANKQGAFELEEADAAIQCLNHLGKYAVAENQAKTMSDSDPIPPDPSKPKP